MSRNVCNPRRRLSRHSPHDPTWPWSLPASLLPQTYPSASQPFAHSHPRQSPYSELS
ncbi:hypothetical protein BJ165DRAFT_1517844 [Panaeolus papilionaceus]|nr:hypothetical protein BJ165DRAFT_1517844 [Panaeolus papilionaceus]